MHQNAPYQRKKYKNVSGADPTPIGAAFSASNPLQTAFLAMGLNDIGFYNRI